MKSPFSGKSGFTVLNLKDESKQKLVERIAV